MIENLKSRKMLNVSQNAEHIVKKYKYIIQLDPLLILI